MTRFAGDALVVLARGESASDVLSALQPFLHEEGHRELRAVAVEPVPPQKTVPVTTGVRSAGVD